jgi:hypothetical protein
MAPKLERTIASTFIQALTDELTKKHSDWLINNQFKTFEKGGEALSLSRSSWPLGWAIRMEMERPRFKDFCIGFHTSKPLPDELQQKILGALKDPLGAIGRQSTTGGKWAAWCFLPDPFRN